MPKAEGDITNQGFRVTEGQIYCSQMFHVVLKLGYFVVFA